ncbi:MULTISPECIES: small membrane protein [unclassified Tatumella]|nr:MULTISPECIES: small membrane protein [unclassified Tatumella]MBS0855976.1 small membrane protein [Tatumella sp. JGM16]MBS0878621.1 small membrane protein [Tatumella sp. JGM82]MBS0892197.1 small membrane protein [Tatumella sp. JGM94]MBS0895496.1 small membrane protein [Tatumella sp. JGM130]MBS0903327.1 small membrane protein [Tatumella sp. JGM100]
MSNFFLLALALALLIVAVWMGVSFFKESRSKRGIFRRR